ncbi:FUSC family protein [Corynebacterium tapiri]|nr:FUSC family protein [Corynebacterium tapiri]
MSEALPTRPNAWQLLVAFNSSAPRWPGALRAALAIFLPGAIALALGHTTEMFLIAAGGCAVIYGEGHPYRSRWRIMSIAGVLIALGATIGAFVGSIVFANINAGGSHYWFLLTVIFCTVMAALGAFIQNALRLRAPGSFFVVMVAGGSTMTARLGLDPLEVGFWALVGAASGVVLGVLPALLDAHGPERRSVDALEHALRAFEESDDPTLGQRHDCQTALAAAWAALGDARVVHAGAIVKPSQADLVRRVQDCQQRLVRRSRLLGLNLTDAEVVSDTSQLSDPTRAAIPHTRPTNAYRIYRSLDLNSHASVTAQKVALASLGAGISGIALGFDRPDWAIVSALLMLQWGPDRTNGQIRGLHRLIGSLIGLGLFVAFHAVELRGWGLLIALALCQFGAEIFVVKNYAFCVIFTTPLALLLGNAVTDPLGEVVFARTVEIFLSILFGSLALWFWAPGAPAREHMRISSRAKELTGTVLGAFALSGRAGGLPQRRDLQYELLSERRAIVFLAESRPELARARWDEHLAIQRAGYHLLDFANAYHGQPVSDSAVAQVTATVRQLQQQP